MTNAQGVAAINAVYAEIMRIFGWSALPTHDDPGGWNGAYEMRLTQAEAAGLMSSGLAPIKPAGIIPAYDNGLGETIKLPRGDGFMLQPTQLFNIPPIGSDVQSAFDKPNPADWGYRFTYVINSDGYNTALAQHWVANWADPIGNLVLMAILAIAAYGVAFQMGVAPNVFNAPLGTVPADAVGAGAVIPAADVVVTPVVDSGVGLTVGDVPALDLPTTALDLPSVAPSAETLQAAGDAANTLFQQNLLDLPVSIAPSEATGFAATLQNLSPGLATLKTAAGAISTFNSLYKLVTHPNGASSYQLRPQPLTPAQYHQQFPAGGTNPGPDTAGLNFSSMAPMLALLAISLLSN